MAGKTDQYVRKINQPDHQKLENQIDHYPGGPADSGDIAQFHKIAIPLARRVFPETIAHELVGVQPLAGPVGLAFALI